MSVTIIFWQQAEDLAKVSTILPSGFGLFAFEPKRYSYEFDDRFLVALCL
jgi:hypothetical protein